MYQTDMFWCHQLFDADWKDDSSLGGEPKNYVEADFLCSLNA